jgi:hypothetical protein
LDRLPRGSGGHSAGERGKHYRPICLAAGHGLNRLVALNAHFVRVHQSFQSALILAERGLTADARVVLRSAVEGAIAIQALAKDAGFVDQMIEAHYRSRRAHARALVDKIPSSFLAEEIAKMNAMISEADAYQVSLGRELTDIKWEQVAQRHCPELYQLFYRDLSARGTHATLDAIEHFFSVDDRGAITAFKPIPDTRPPARPEQRTRAPVSPRRAHCPRRRRSSQR